MHVLYEHFNKNNVPLNKLPCKYMIKKSTDICQPAVFIYICWA